MLSLAVQKGLFFSEILALGISQLMLFFKGLSPIL